MFTLKALRIRQNYKKNDPNLQSVGAMMNAFPEMFIGILTI